VSEVLGEGSNLSEVLWNFSRYTGKEREKRLTLKQSPHFYKSLPRAPLDYGDDFQSDPIENFLDTPEHKIFVLTNRQGRVYLESEKDPRAFSNVWCPQRAIIFKGSFLAFSKFAHLDTSLDNLQTSVESSRVKGLSGHPSQARALTYGIAWRVSHWRILWIGSHYRTGDNQFTATC
jgi:hypothetical protein